MRRLILLILICGSPALAQTPELTTRAERTNYEETSTYDEVMAIVKALAASSPFAKVESFGLTEEGRALPLLILSDPGVSSPEEARRLKRPIVFVQANIHGGEVEGKEASLILARRLVSGDLKPLLRRLVVLMAPIYNADGNEKFSLDHRTSQNGPIGGVGTRENAKGLDLNRDYMKLDSAEARALVRLINRWDPHAAIDLHTTNGSYHGYHLTYSPPLNPNADPRLIEFARERILAPVDAAVEKKHPFRISYYGNFASEGGGPRESARVDPENPGDTIWRTFDHRPRFGNNYLGLRNRLAILSEAYSYLDFRGRVRVTEVFVEELLNTIADNGPQLLSLTAQLDADAKGLKGELGVRFDFAPLPEPVEILVGDVTKMINPRSGREMLAMSDTATPVRMKDYGIFKPTLSVPVPRGWLIPHAHVENGRLAAALERLRLHGITIQRVAAPAEIRVERVVITDMERSPRPFQGHQEVRLTLKYEPALLSIVEGALFVPSTQPLGRLAFYLLEAASDDGLVTWNIIDQGIAPGETYPIYRVMDVSRLKLVAEEAEEQLETRGGCQESDACLTPAADLKTFT